MRSRYTNWRARRYRGEAGFTLVELLVVVGIIGVLVAIAIPVYSSFQKDARDKATESDVRNVALQVQMCLTSGETIDGLDTVEAGDELCSGSIATVSNGTKMTLAVNDPNFTIKAWNESGKKYTAEDNAATWSSAAGGLQESSPSDSEGAEGGNT